jgi:hypothetical protein
MDPVALILAALVAGATKAAGDVAQDAYDGLKTLIKCKFASQNKSDSSVLLDKSHGSLKKRGENEIAKAIMKS